MKNNSATDTTKTEYRSRTAGIIATVAFLLCLIGAAVVNVYVQNNRAAPAQPYRNNFANISGEDASSTTQENIIEDNDLFPEDEILTENSPQTLKDFLLHALEPVGSTLYVYGGGWNEEDTGAGAEAMTYGPSPRWKEFFDENDSTYDQAKTVYQIHDGLDCTGYIGYTAYQTFGDGYSSGGYVFESGKVIDSFMRLFGGHSVGKNEIKKRRAGDIMAKNGHAFITVGECSDGSVLLLHSSPPCTTFSGTPTPAGVSTSEAAALAQKYMSKIAPEAYGRYPQNCVRGMSYLRDYDQFSFDESVLPDPDGLREMTAEEVLAELFE